MKIVALFLIALLSVPLHAAPIPASDQSAAETIAKSPRHGEWVDIALPGSDVKIKSWIVYPEVKDKAAVVIVIHEIFGLTDWIRSVADQLAADGFIAIAPDLLSGMGPSGGGTAELGDKAREVIRKITPEDQAARLDAIRAYALALPAANGKLGSVGFCWGGSASFNYASRQPALNAAVVYYGTAPAENDQLAKITCPVLGLYGSDDARVNATLDKTKASMSELKKEYAPIVYEGAGHGFLRQQSGKDGANLKATEQAWKETIEFFKKHLAN